MTLTQATLIGIIIASQIYNLQWLENISIAWICLLLVIGCFIVFGFLVTGVQEIVKEKDRISTSTLYLLGFLSICVSLTMVGCGWWILASCYFMLQFTILIIFATYFIKNEQPI